VPDTSRAQDQRDLCLLKKAVKTLLEKQPEGMTHEEICRLLLRDARFSGTYCNLTSRAHSILRILIEEEKIRCRGNGRDRIYVWLR
jgi:hypothetical protein